MNLTPDILNRITEEISLLCSQTGYQTIRSMGTILHLPYKVVYDDIKALANSLELGNGFKESYIRELNSTSLEEIADKCIIFEPDVIGLVSTEDADQLAHLLVPFYFSEYEKFLIESVLEQNNGFRNYDTSEFYIKTPIQSITELMREKYGIISNAIDNKRWIRFNYRTMSDSRIITVITFPIYVLEESIEQTLYCVGFSESGESYYRIDRILGEISILAHSKEPGDIPIFNVDYADFANRWGPSPDKSMHPVHVKVRIDPTASNILEKIRTDTYKHLKSNNTYGNAVLYEGTEGDQYWYYEETLTGINSFKRWLRQFGSSTIVLEPRWLAVEIYESYCQLLAIYEDSGDTEK